VTYHIYLQRLRPFTWWRTRYIYSDSAHLLCDVQDMLTKTLPTYLVTYQICLQRLRSLNWWCTRYNYSDSAHLLCDVQDMLTETLPTYLVTYQIWPVALSLISRLFTVTSWKLAPFSFRKNVSGIHTWLRLDSPSRTSLIFLWIGGKTSRGSRHACLRYMLTE